MDRKTLNTQSPVSYLTQYALNTQALALHPEKVAAQITVPEGRCRFNGQMYDSLIDVFRAAAHRLRCGEPSLRGSKNLSHTFEVTLPDQTTVSAYDLAAQFVRANPGLFEPKKKEETSK